MAPPRWRDLLDHLQIAWADRGPNVSHGHLVVRCPWCGASDPSRHLGINEETGAYRCLRSNNHQGRSPYYLLRALGVRGDIDDLLAEFGGTGKGTRPTSLPPRSAIPLAQRWERLPPAVTDPEALAYLERRNFPDPARTCREFDLRTGLNTMSRRVWFGLRGLDGAVVGFTGRAIDDWRQPRYYTEAAEPVLYMPRLPDSRHRLALVVEGPFDALRIADATRRRYNIFVAALCGLAGVTGNKRLQLAEIARTVPHFAVALDSSVWAVDADAQHVMDELRAIPAIGRVTQLPPPPEVADPGEMTDRQVERWLSQI